MFDTGTNSQLLEHLQNSGMRVTQLSNYFSRTLQTENNMQTLKMKKTILYGAPQEAVIGPKLLILYINNVLEYHLGATI